MTTGGTDTFDMVIKGGRILDAKNNVDRVADIGFCAGRATALAPDIPADGAADVIDARGCIVAPGLLDLHAHVYVHGTSLGVDPGQVARASGTTTFIDAGSSGAGNFTGFRYHVIEPADVRILAFLNVSFPGIFGFGTGIMVGECLDQRLLHVGECLRVAREHQDLIVGLKVRIGIGTSGALGVHPLDIALEIAEALDCPVMAHIGAPPPRIGDVLDRLRRGDILTHCFRPFPNAVADGRQEPRAEFLAAKERGVVFDIGHGSGSFGFGTCRTMLESGFPPDVISSDVHTLSINGPAFDLLTTMSKFLSLGMTEAEVIRAATATPAAAIDCEDLGHLGTGAVGDAAVLAVEHGAFRYEDTVGEVITGERRFALKHLIVGGARLA